MTEEVDIWRAAHLLVKRYGAEATALAGERTNGCMVRRDVDGEMIWRRILATILELQRTKLAAGERYN